MNLRIAPNSVQDITVREKLAFFWAHIGNVPIMVTINSFLLIFYTDVVGLNPAAIGTLFLIARVIDGFNDPIIGYIVDHLPYTRWGRFRPYVIMGSFICAINFLLLWLGPSMASTGKLAIAYVTYLTIGITFDFMDIPLGAILPTLTNDEQERNSISSYKGVAYLLGYTAITVGTIPLVNLFPTPQEGWHTTIIIYAIIVIILSFAGVRGIQERITPHTEERYGFRDIFKILFQTRPLAIILVATIAVNVGVGLGSGTSIFYYTYNLGDENYFTLSGLVSLPGVIVGVLIFNWVGHKYEKSRMMMLLMLFAATGVGARMFIPYTAINLVMASVFVSSVGSGGAIPLIFAMIADTVDYTEWRHGFRAEGAVSAIQTFMQKTGLGLGGAIPGFILASTGYVPNSAQSPAALNGILLTTSTLPFFFFLLAAIAIGFYTIDKKTLQNIKISRETRLNG
ncbi:MAG: glycoside-pentoside-hexuronide (GPH):cation symporter [Chloroflexota bacterium]